MKISQALCFCVAGIILASCSNLKSEPKAAAPTPKKTMQIDIASLTTKVDPVCGMTLKQGEVGDTLTYQGKLYGFCGSGCKDDFVKTPAQYLNQQ